MSLFPKCTFQVLVPGGLVVPGTRLDGHLVIDAPEPIPRAEHVDLVFATSAWAGYGSGKSRSVVRRPLWTSPFRVPVNADLLPAGQHRIPFSVDVPPWLPPGYRGSDCAIEHVIEVRLDVDWALDPTMRMVPAITLAPREAVRAPLTLRSPHGFHDTLVVEATLASSVITHGEPLRGHVALRSGHDARFDALELTLLSAAVVRMGPGVTRVSPAGVIRIPAEALRSGEAIAFQFPSLSDLLPTFRNGFIDHEVMLRLSADIAWAVDPHFDIPLEHLPRGSSITGGAAETVVGSERLRRIAAAMADATGLHMGRAPVLVEGNIGPVHVRVADAPRNGTLGIDVDLTFPDMELGIDFRRLGVLDGFRTSPLLPAALQAEYLLRCKPVDERAPVDPLALEELVFVLLSDLGRAHDLRFSDHHLGAHFALADDGGERMVGVARAACEKAKHIGEVIRRLPFPAAFAHARSAWEATAAEQGSLLVATGPALHGLSMRARVLTGEERAITLSLRTVWQKNGPATHVDVDLRHAPVPESARAELESAAPSERLRAVRAVFASAHLGAEGEGATLVRGEATADPRALLSALESFFRWVLDVRGERRVDAPYR